VRTGAFAAAKVNLFLHVGPPEPSGYHPVSSLAVFADVGDRLSVAPAETFEFVVEGPFAPALKGEDDNLVLRAIRDLESAIGEAFGPMRLILQKNLPVAAGLGGGTSDAAAALRLLDIALGLVLPDELLAAVASELGADGALCFAGAPAIAEGRGERLSPAPQLPELHAVLVNPGRPSPTKTVYAAYDAAGLARPVERPDLPEAFESAAELAAFLALTRNDLERPAVLNEPAIGEVLARLHAAPETLLARMSGSGATCFALTEGEFDAASLAESLAREHVSWWVTPCRLGGPWDACEVDAGAAVF
jgi:4-diphosphocytidyl-2-C-methyl-D-erythritol kinase